MNSKNILISAALSGIILGITSACSNLPFSSEPNDANVGHCQGINSCKGKGSCGGKSNGCAGLNQCKSKGWLRKTEAECTELKGQFES
jgi:hypothetical protein